MTPSKIKSMALEDLRKICYDYTVTGLEALSSREGGSRKPLRFVYVSGAKAERDQSKKSWILGDYTILRVCWNLLNPSIYVVVGKGEGRGEDETNLEYRENAKPKYWNLLSSLTALWRATYLNLD